MFGLLRALTVMLALVMLDAVAPTMLPANLSGLSRALIVVGAVLVWVIFEGLLIRSRTVSNRRKPKADSKSELQVGRGFGINATGAEDLILDDCEFVGFDTPIHAPDSKRTQIIKTRFKR